MTYNNSSTHSPNIIRVRNDFDDEETKADSEKKRKDERKKETAPELIYPISKLCNIVSKLILVLPQSFVVCNVMSEREGAVGGGGSSYKEKKQQLAFVFALKKF